MSFEYAVSEMLSAEHAGSARSTISFKARPNMSLSKLTEGGNAVEIRNGEIKRIDYKGWHGERFLFARALKSEILLVLYEVNNSRLLAYRGSVLNYNHVAAIRAEARKMLSAKPNLEARMIGGQDDDGITYARDVLNLTKDVKAKLMESDLFGKEFRHVAVDSRFGMTYNVLLEDRPYRAGELMVQNAKAPA